MKRFLALALSALLLACAGKTSPSWLSNSHTALNAHLAAYLSGRERVATQELLLARREVARTGDATMMARVELTACAAQIASLATSDCPAFTPLAADAAPAENAYATYLSGKTEGLDSSLLPPAQRQSLSRNPTLNNIADPLSRLVAAAVAWRSGRLSAEGIAVAIDTAASEGWRRPLLAWLAVDRDQRRAAGDTSGADAAQRRIERIVGDGK